MSIIENAKVAILFLCDKKQCPHCSSHIGQCFHTTRLAHAVNYSSYLDVSLENGFDILPEQNKLIFVEKEC